jgi:hypothetical protein
LGEASNGHVHRNSERKAGDYEKTNTHGDSVKNTVGDGYRDRYTDTDIDTAGYGSRDRHTAGE